MTFRELLPDGCPPDEAEEITGSRVVFRLVRNMPPDDDDFRSQRTEQPSRVFRGVTECQARGLSVHADHRDSENALKLPALQGRTICRIALDNGAGYIQQTGRPSHHTWWPWANFNILGHCSLVEL